VGPTQLEKNLATTVAMQTKHTSNTV
jgi:hypothetical protein